MKEIYLQLIEQGWTLQSIDGMDFFYYMDLLIYKATTKDKEQSVYIDQVL